MLFNSFQFYVFFLAVLGAYWSIPKRWQWILLLGASYWFYMSWEPQYAVLIFTTTLVSYLAALGIEKFQKYKNIFLGMAVAADLGILLVFKYANFAFQSLEVVLQQLGSVPSLPVLQLLLPVGISFYTFQTVSYVIDVYRGKETAEKHFGYFALFVSFFPQLVAGPIERAANLLPQLKEEHGFDYDRVVSGAKLFTVGLFKKIVIADNLALVVDQVFTSLPEYKGLSLVFTMILFSGQIYCDFSGYTDMARGVARILGVYLVENFKQPYFATSITDFWRRWHISLSQWFRDYLYIPLGGNRKGMLRTLLNLVIVFVVCGLWHGAAWTFVLWGALHGIVMAGERVAQGITRGRVHVPRVVAVGYTNVVVILSWVLFRAQTLGDAQYIYLNMVRGARHFFSPSYIEATLSQLFTTNVVELSIVVGCLVVLLAIESLSSLPSWKVVFYRWPAPVRWSVYSAAIALVFLLQNAEIQEFIYFQF